MFTIKPVTTAISADTLTAQVRTPLIPITDPEMKTMTTKVMMFAFSSWTEPSDWTDRAAGSRSHRQVRFLLHYEKHLPRFHLNID